MRKIYFLLIAVLFNLIVFAQVPEKFSYQAIIRDSDNNLVVNSEVGIQISIIQGSATGSSVYTEVQYPMTNENGLVSIEIGAGTSSDNFSSIDWSSGTYFIKTETDPLGGKDYTITGTSQLLSVPFALRAKTVENDEVNDADNDPENELQLLNLDNNQLSISNGNVIILPDGMSTIPIYSTEEISSLTPVKGQAVYNSSESLYQIYTGGYWVSFPATNCWPQPTIANAGEDQNIISGNTTANLTANQPDANHGIGKWSIISGTGGSFSSNTDPHTDFSGETHTTYILRWTITTSCSQSIDEVVVTFSDDGLGDVLIDIDGNSYNTIWIGSQLWMAENLKVTKYADGSVMQYATTDANWSNLSDNDKAYCFVNYDSNSEYGAMYTWAAVMNGASSTNNDPSGVQGVCPDGWHLPSNAEWDKLVDYIGGRSEGGKLKETGTIHWNAPNEAATNETGFTALPGGIRDIDGIFNGIGVYGYWWVTQDDESNPALAYYRNLFYNSKWITTGNDSYYKKSGNSVRCIKD